MTKLNLANILLKMGAVAMLTVGAITLAHADSDKHEYKKSNETIELSKRPKTIVLDNLDTSNFDKGDPAVAAVAHEVCGDCHSVDYLTTQPKLSCATWAREIVKMGNTFDARIPWQEDVVTYSTLNTILVYLADNYGQGSAGCDMNAVRAVPGLSE